ncbi:MAG: hypothetical protein ABSH10_03135 [Phycisphaerae bacterium]|jgi:hypothetical protein
MSTLDALDLFGSGPHAFRAGPWERATIRRGFSGLDGELVLDLGLRSRAIVQTGRLQAVTAEAMAALVGAIESAANGCCHSLVDNHGQVYPRVIVEEFQPTTPTSRGRGFWCDYILRYRQLP